MDEPSPRASRRKWMLLAAVALFVLGFAAAAPATYFFVRDAFPAMTNPIAELDEGELQTIDLGEDEIPAVLAIVVGSLDDQVPPLSVTIRTPEGEPVPTGEADGWATILGRHYRRVINITPDAPGPIELRVDAEGDAASEDFALFRHPDATMRRYVSRAAPFWTAGGVLALLALVLVIAAIVLKASEPDEAPL